MYVRYVVLILVETHYGIVGDTEEVVQLAIEGSPLEVTQTSTLVDGCSVELLFRANDCVRTLGSAAA
jgi:hypothetical protein